MGVSEIEKCRMSLYYQYPMGSGIEVEARRKNENVKSGNQDLLPTCPKRFLPVF